MQTLASKIESMIEDITKHTFKLFQWKEGNIVHRLIKCKYCGRIFEEGLEHQECEEINHGK